MTLAMPALKIGRPVYQHRHRVASIQTTPWTQCVWPAREHSERPHGNIVETQECRCGAWRHVEINGGMRVASVWMEDEA